MRAQDIVIGEHYRHKDSPCRFWLTVRNILQPHEGKNPHNKIIVECLHTTDKNKDFGFIRYFCPRDLIKDRDQ